MIMKWKWDRQFAKIGLFSFLLAGLLVIYTWGAFPEFSIEALLITAYGQLGMNEIKYFIPVIIWMIPQFVLLYLTGEEWSKQLEHRAVYIFTRMSRRSLWLRSAVMDLWIKVVYFFIVQFLVLAAAGWLCGLRGSEGKNMLLTVMLEFLLLILYNFCLVLGQNVLSLYTGPMVTFLMITVFVLLQVIAVGALYEYAPEAIGLGKYTLFAHSIVLWHESPLLSPIVGLFSGEIVAGMNILFSIIYLGLVCVLLLALARSRIEKMDIV